MYQKTSPVGIIQKAFPGIRLEEAEQMVKTGEIHSYPANQILCQEGALESVFYILLKGKVRVTKLINPAEVRLLTTLKPGDFFGEMAIIHNAPRAATVTATEPATVLEFHKEDFDELLNRSSVVSLAMVREVSRRLRENDEMAIEDLRIKARELAEAYQQLAEQDYARQEFLTTIAHELRTPLTAAYGYVQSIRMGMLQSADREDALVTISRNLEEIISLVNDILFLQEMELILLEFQPTDVGMLVKTVIEKESRRARRVGVNLTMELVPDLPPIPADPKSLERVIHILIDNAIKYSPEGGETLLEVGYDHRQVWVCVKDNGVGIPPEAMPRLFRRYFRLDEVDGHLFSGAGLGLSIARQVVEQHGGRIEVKSEVGKGSTISFYLMREKV